MTERPDRAARDKTQVIPEPVRPDLFAFLEKLFDGAEQKPEKIELRQAYGPGARKYATSTITQKEFKTNAVKPTREQLVAMSNEFVDLAQSNCNEVGKAHKYGVLAKHYAKSDAYYGVFVLSLKPRQRADYEPGDGDEDDDDFGDRDRRHRDSLLSYSLDHIKQADENERWRQEQFALATGDLLERYQNLNQMLMQHNMELQKEHRELFKTADEALSRKSEREMAAEMQKFKIGMMQDGFQFLKQMAPVAVNQLTGKQTIPTEKSNESIAIEQFLEGLTEQQAVSLFGTMQDGKLLGDGIFTPEQAEIFAGVANCTVPPTALDQLFVDGSEVSIKPEQIMKAQGVVAAQQFGPLVALFMTRNKKDKDKQA